MYKIKHFSRHENKVNENKVLSYCEALRCETIKNKKSCFPLCQTYKPTGEWSIHGAKRRKDNQL